jgi:hypothetical protein
LTANCPTPGTLIGIVQAHLSRWSGYEAFHSAMVASQGLAVYLVGGAIRDSALMRDRRHGDFDFIIQGSSLNLFLARLKKAGNLGVGPLKSPRWFPGGQGTAYCDIVPLQAFNQGFGPCRSIHDCLAQFDVTANALALEIQRSDLFDPYQGLDDLRNRSMRMVRFDHPAIPVRPGNLLTWRAVAWCRVMRFVATLGLHPEPATARWLRENKPLRAQRNAFTATFQELDSNQS